MFLAHQTLQISHTFALCRECGGLLTMAVENIDIILDVNLTTKQVTAVDLDAEVERNFIGGLGLGIKLLYDQVGPRVDAFSPDNIIVLAPGPLSGTAAPTNSRVHIMTKSPLTGIIGMGNFGGWWGPRLKRAGFEAVLIRGKSDTPVYLWIDDGVAQLRSAQHLWGKDSWETTDALKEELGSDVSLLTIGPAGENLVRFACPVADYDHAPGRSTAGCVMGDKKLKAIAVRGTKEVPIADERKFRKAVVECTERISSWPQRGERLTAGSHGRSMRFAVESGGLFIQRFVPGTVAPDSDIFRLPDSFEENTKLVPGFNRPDCPEAYYWGCDLVADVKAGPYVSGRLQGGVNFGFIASIWGGTHGIKTYPAMFKCRELCQRYGMDQVTPIIFAMDLLRNGIITKDDCDGLDLNPGNESDLMEMLGRIAHRQGFGDTLAEGSERAAKKIGRGAEKYVLTIKGQDIMSEPRTKPWAIILGQAVCPRGGDDLNSTHGNYDLEILPFWARETGWSEEQYVQWLVNYLDMFSDVKEKVYGSPPSTEYIKMNTFEGRATLVIWFEKMVSIFDSLGLCMASANWQVSLGPTYWAKLYSGYTGREVTARELVRTGDRICNLMRAYNAREGFTRKDDDYPAMYYEEPLAAGPSKGTVLSREKMNRILDEYYTLRGWDKEKGIPTKSKLIELGLKYAADELSRLGRI